MTTPRLSVVTPTLLRPVEVEELVGNLTEQKARPDELVLVDGAPAGETATARVVEEARGWAPFPIVYLRSPRGTAVQRNAGIDVAAGGFVAFVDDDVRLEPDFFAVILEQFERAEAADVGGIVGYRTNTHFLLSQRARWRWYRRLRLLTTFEPGRYDFRCGYPINTNLQAPFTGTRDVDFMTTACAVWRREVFDSGLRFDPFFRDFGVLEDAHFALRAGRRWRLLQCGDAHCVELTAPGGRVSTRAIGFKSVVNYHYVFTSVAGPLTWGQRLRFWRFQLFELVRSAAATARGAPGARADLRGRLEGIVAVCRGQARGRP